MKKFQRKAQIVAAVIIATALAFIVSGCGISQKEQKEVANFYIDFAREATSLDADAISKAYAELAEEDFEGQNSNMVRDKMFAKFNSINPEFFSKIHFADSSYTEVGKTYSTILLLSLATEGEGIEVTMPSDAVTSYYDDEISKQVYEIDRKKITAMVPELVALKLDRPNRNGLAPVKIVKIGEEWKVLADTNMLTEIGIPLSEKISAPETEK